MQVDLFRARACGPSDLLRGSYGLDAALVRVGARTLIDIEKLNQWLERGRVG